MLTCERNVRLAPGRSLDPGIELAQSLEVDQTSCRLARGWHVGLRCPQKFGGMALLALLAGACDQDSESKDDSVPGTDSQDSGSNESDSDSEGTDSDSGDSDNGTDTGTGGCLQHEDFQCAAGIECPATPNHTDWCGPDGPFDENGCLRRRCQEDDDCESGEVCYAPAMCHQDACVASSWSCEEGDDRSCICGGSGDCATTPIYCIRADDVPC